MTSLRVCAALLVLVAACAKKESAAGDSAGSVATTAAPSDDAARAAAVSNAIAANPAGADSILKANGWTAEQFEKMMYDIAADSAKSAQYAAAKTK